MLYYLFYCIDKDKMFSEIFSKIMLLYLIYFIDKEKVLV